MHVIHVIDTLVVIELEEALSPMQEGIRAGIMHDALVAWKDFSKLVAGAERLSIEVQVNNRISGILNWLRKNEAELLVLGAFGDRKPDVGFGTVATACVRRSPVDVLLVRDTQRQKPFSTIIACVDFSDTSREALRMAAKYAQRDGAALHILHVFAAPWHRLHYRSPTVESDPRFQRQYRAGLQGRLEAFTAELGDDIKDITPQFVVFDYQGHRSGIVEYARQAQADLIVMGTRGRANLRDIFLGSTAEKLLQQSTCSVLAVKPRPLDESNSREE